MRPSLSLTLIALMANFAYGFSTSDAAGGAGGAFFRHGGHHRHPLRPRAAVPAVALPSSTRINIPRGGGFGGGGSNKEKKATQIAASSAESGDGSSSSGGLIDTGSKCPVTGLAALFGSVWGVTGVLYVLAKAVKRVMPIALEPFQAGAVPLSQFELGAYIVTCLWFAYVEGYKGFQLKFSPLVVKRSFTLIPGKNGTKWYHYFLAPMYTMGMLHATKKRKIVSYSVTVGVAAIVAAVKRFPYPWRNIVDAGVVVGLTWGSLSIVAMYLKAWFTGKPPAGIDAALPEPKN